MTFESTPTLLALHDSLAKLQSSARATIPLFLVGVAATIIAAVVALYYILTLSADLKEARHALQQSQSALMSARENLASINASLRQAQKEPASPARASSIAMAISDVSRTQASIRTASSSISSATEKLSTPVETRTDKQVSITDTIKNEQRELSESGTFEVMDTEDGFLSLRSQPTAASAEIARIPVGASLQCGPANRNINRRPWRRCEDSEGRTGFASNKYLRKG